MNKSLKKIGLSLVALLTISGISTVGSKPASAGVYTPSNEYQSCASKNRNWLWSDCVFPTANGWSYSSLNKIKVVGGSGATFLFKNANNNDKTYIHANLNETVYNPYSSSPTDVYVRIDNFNWGTDFRLNP